MLFPQLLHADTIKVKTRAPQNQQAVFQCKRLVSRMSEAGLDCRNGNQSFCLIGSNTAVPLIRQERIHLRSGGIGESAHDVVKPLSKIDVIQFA